MRHQRAAGPARSPLVGPGVGAGAGVTGVTTATTGAGATGVGAGMGAIFKAPLGGAILGAEILYRRDFEFEVLWPAFIASIVGYSIFASWNGWSPIFSFTGTFTFTRPAELLGYAVLGILCGVAGIAYGRSFHGVRILFARWKIPGYVKPAVGGLAVGIIGLFLPQVLAGY